MLGSVAATADTDNDVPVPIGLRFEDALVYATRAHAVQVRKGTGIPYVAHLLAVASLVLEDGGDEDEAVAALLHDAVEDQGGAKRLREIGDRYGERVAEIVLECSDTDVAPKPPWRDRKIAYIEHVATASDGAVRVSLADKLHNARAVLYDYRRLGEALWERFNPEADQLWYFRALVSAFRTRTDGPMLEELDRVVTELEQVSGMGALRKLAADGEGWVELRADGEAVRFTHEHVREARTDEDFRELVRLARVRLYEGTGVVAGAAVTVHASWRRTASS
jgi:HD domain